MPTLQPSGDMLGMNMMLTCRAGVPEMPNAQELFWCWRKASHHLRQGVEGLLMHITRDIEATHGKDASLKWFVAYEEGLRELYLPYEWDEMCGPLCGVAADGGDDCTYSEHEPSSWMYLGAEDEHEWVTSNHKGRAGGKQLAALLEKLVDQFARTAAPILSNTWTEILTALCFPLQDWHAVSEALLAEDTAALKASLTGSEGHQPFAIVANRMAGVWDGCFGDWTDPDTRRPPTKVFDADMDAILDQTVGAAWRRDPFVLRWQGNALMYYPLRIFSDRAWASLFLWLEAGVTPLQALRADWLKRPEQ